MDKCSSLLAFAEESCFYVIFQIQYQIDEGTDVFEVNNATGALRPLKEIDRERNSAFRISIRAVDKGFPPKHSSAKVCNNC